MNPMRRTTQHGSDRRRIRPASSPAALAVLLTLLGAGCARDPAPVAGQDATAATPAPSAPRQRALLDSPQARAWRGHEAFEREARAFVRDAPRLDAAARDRRADRLEQQIRDRERSGELSAGETMLLRAALVQAQSGSSEEQARRMAALVKRYRQDAVRREAAWVAQQRADPRMRDYKTRERAVVAEVMAMPTIPGGLSRDAYLRQRLQAERERAWGGG